ncbi:Asp-tRNA(Asn)/Glu-tRNA(Gln) amidotransferase subunit GatA [archaeon]|jgi:aspartyl-tRNA(Asn)/glutamyl-tRNA(Gln) amidotransferase subunit A|nr:Asp-tRNA(Asn)/Glu-tRNA(Gln) amidotransferase subunit GatA [archaeon]MBT6823815.1 Asp-tRNA(Asn)/Glu-tRNA(Gln) amidotransferase subunit GatA [archaeon]MBT7107150.1 Asp-tRNA(Asn)/Glu-tRNA(Gln) amidotransferase subunit GatA [archaeon]MBT7297260.1 Asp-tRNA(Asn)/Glu-tRNA(Gln) amidotransferase subunit GatA [archaeon]
MIDNQVKEITKGKVKCLDYTKNAIKRIKEINKDNHYITTMCEDLAISQAKEIDSKTKKGKLAGTIFTIKDNICVKDVESTANSKILDGYKPIFDATVVEKLKREGAIIVGKDSCDAFGFGGFNVNVGVGKNIPKNPIDSSRTCGGSSGGSGGITKKADFVHVAIGESTGGSIECPSAFCGVVGFCPTYGLVSRWGLISYADSFDKIGVMTKTVEDNARVMSVIAGHDNKDGTSLKVDKKDYVKSMKEDSKKLKIAIIKDGLSEGTSQEVKESFNDMVETLKKDGFEIDEISLPLTFKYGIATYYILATSESSTNLSRFSGLRYGVEENKKGKYFDDYFSEIRSKNFNTESKRRIMLGTFTRMAGFRDAYYIKATKARTKIIEEYKNQFEKYDLLISPTMPIVPPKFSDIKKMSALEAYTMDILTVGPNLAGIPHASMPIHKGDLPIGMMVMADHLQEDKIYRLLKRIEELR